MKVISWNINGNVRAWDYLRQVVAPSIALLQEVPNLQLPSGEALAFNATVDSREIPGRQGTAVYTRGLPVNTSPIMASGERFAAADVVVAHGVVVLVASIHPDTKRSNLSAVRQVESVLSAIESRLGTPTRIIGGDLNTARNASQYWPGPKWRHDDFWRNIDSGEIGLHDCFRKFHSAEVQTYFFRGKPQTTGWRARKFQLDHLFVSADLYTRVSFCDVLDTPEVRALSDHLPLVAEIDI
jgi:exonuclease III